MLQLCNGLAPLRIAGRSPTTLHAEVAELRQVWPQLDTLERPVAFLCERPERQLAAAAWLATTQGDGLVASPSLGRDRLLERLTTAGFVVLGDDGLLAEPAGSIEFVPGRIRLLTSGTTGEPKIVSHTWQSLFTMSRLRDPAPRRWLLTYLPGSYAWYQVVCLGLFVSGQVLCAGTSRDPAEQVAAGIALGADAVSATPTFWRNALLRVPQSQLGQWPVAQLTLGGERVDQAILDRLRSLFPAASITHIYAATEVGAAIVVKDGLEGFPAQWLQPQLDQSDAAPPAVAASAPPEQPQLRLVQGRLQVQSPYASAAAGSWLDTGDRVEVRGDRAYILGREAGSLINVGGAKVLCRDVEAALLGHPEVVWCRVYGRRSPVTGELVCADVVRAPNSLLTEATLLRSVAPQLADYAVPRLVRFLPAIPTSANQKTELATS